ncbi:MAG: OmpA family protein [Leptolyngbyaceae cyanobacterium CSU_1_4]|nr:OmpA family protein [Leptolyngbyaceae cyanobacterium CSU_1_4]
MHRLENLTTEENLSQDEVDQLHQFLNLLVDLDIIEPEPTIAKEIEKEDEFPIEVGLHLEQLPSFSMQINFPLPPPPLETSIETNETQFQQLQQLLMGAELRILNDLIAGSRQQVLRLEHQIYDPQELSELLLPRIGELLAQKVAHSKEEMIEAIAPIIDQIIQSRTQQNRQSMGNALASSISPAIAQQVALNSEELSDAIAPTMGQAIKKQIFLEQDAMVDALYPIIGNTVGKYMGATLDAINEKIEQTLSVEGITRKIRAKMQGVSEAELIIREVMPSQVQAIFLIHKASGLVIAEVQHPEQHLESDMLAGMLTAIRGFVNDCISQSGDLPLELDSIDYGTSKIVLEVAGYCYLATVVKGEPSAAFIKMMQSTLRHLVCQYDPLLHHFDGNSATLPEDIQKALEILRDSGESAAEKGGKPSALFFCGLAIVGLMAVPWSIFQYLGFRQQQAESAAVAALYAAPQLSIYNLQVEAKQDYLSLSGRVPNGLLRQKAEQVVAVALPKWQVKNEIVAVEVPADPVLAAAEVQRVTRVLNRLEGVAIATRYHHGKVWIEGTISPLIEASHIPQSFAQIPGVLSTLSTVQVQPLRIEVRFYFEPDVSSLHPSDRGYKLQQVINFLNHYPRQSLKIIGYSNSPTREPGSEQIALDRAHALKQALTERGIDPSRLQIQGSTDLPPGVDSTQPNWLSRCVIVEPTAP